MVRKARLPSYGKGGAVSSWMACMLVSVSSTLFNFAHHARFLNHCTITRFVAFTT